MILSTSTPYCHHHNNKIYRVHLPSTDCSKIRFEPTASMDGAEAV